jgi:dipeptidase D
MEEGLSMITELDGLQPALFWRHFHEITRIPRCSGHEDLVREYIIQIAKSVGLHYRVDGAGNLVIVKPARDDVGARPIVILQSHLDMVCEKEGDREFDFNTGPIELVREGDWLKAKGTTLGADNGVGVALSLAVIEQEGLEHGPLEFLFTVGEEIGLKGAHAVTPEMLEGRILINLDSEDIDTFCIGCAGSRFTTILLTPTFETSHQNSRQGFREVRLIVDGLTGGHSGLDINLGRANALKLLGRLLCAAQQKSRFLLKDVRGGSSLNAIPRRAEALGNISDNTVETLVQTASDLEAVFKKEYHPIEPNLAVRLETTTVTHSQRVFSQGFQHKVINLLRVVPHGVYSMDASIPGLVKTSTNLATIGLEDGSLTIGTKQRSSEDSEIHAVSDMIGACADLAGATVKIGGDYPGWTPNPDSSLLDCAKEVYTCEFGRKPEVVSIHAGLECGLLKSKFEGLEAVSIGATIQNAHSPDEALQIPSVPKLWKLVTGLLANIAV